MAEPTRLARLLIAGGVAVAAIGVVAVPAPQATGQSTESASTVEPGTESAYRVDDVVPDLRSTGRRLIARSEGIEPFTTIGASYTSPSGEEGRVRAHLPEGWTPWFELHHAHGPGPVTDPIWVGDDADGYEIRLPGDAAAVVVHLVRPTGEAVELTPTPAPRTEAGNPAPPVQRRGAWGAAPYRGPIRYNARVTRGIVHHTVNTNGYSAAQVPGMLRSIQAFHQSSPRNWPDIAYNFIVDRFGTIWEARAQSYDRLTRVSATSGTTIDTVTVAFLGDGSNQAAPSGSVRAMGRLLGWKLRKHGLRPTRANIVGHTEIGQTSCPGAALLRQVPTIERIAIEGNPPPGPFYDVPWTNPNARAVDWADEQGIIPGYDDFTFRPLRRASRAEAVVWLWRAAGSPPGSPHPYTDIPAGALYTRALNWSSRNGIVRPLTTTRFGPTRLMTRQAFLEALWRGVGSPRIALDHPFTDAGPRESFDWASATRVVPGTTVRPGAALQRMTAAAWLYRLRPYTDLPRTHPARKAVDWARAHAVVSGFGNHTFRPGLDLTRGQGSGWVWRFLDRPGGGPVDPDPKQDDVVRSVAVTWLWEAAGSPAVTLPSDYGDVTGTPHEMAAAWAQDHRLFVDFAQNPNLAANTPVTRAQFVRALFRLAQRPTAWADPDTAPGTVQF